MAAAWAQHRLSANPHALARIYHALGVGRGEVLAVSSMKKSMRDRIRWWIADPTGVKHIVPGSSATQWYWGPNYASRPRTRTSKLRGLAQPTWPGPICGGRERDQ